MKIISISLLLFLISCQTEFVKLNHSSSYEKDDYTEYILVKNYPKDSIDLVNEILKYHKSHPINNKIFDRVFIKENDIGLFGREYDYLHKKIDIIAFGDCLYRIQRDTNYLGEPINYFEYEANFK